MEITPSSMDSQRVKDTMRVLPFEEAKEGVRHFIEEPLEETDALSRWDLSFSEYIEEHKSSKLLFCWYAKGVGVVLSPSDHHGIWAVQHEGISGKGKLPEFALGALERIAKEKGLL
jgi:hypothetical protein